MICGKPNGSTGYICELKRDHAGSHMCEIDVGETREIRYYAEWEDADAEWEDTDTIPPNTERAT